MLMPLAVVVVDRSAIQDVSVNWENLDCVRKSYRRNIGKGNCIDIVS